MRFIYLPVILVLLWILPSPAQIGVVTYQEVLASRHAAAAGGVILVLSGGGARGMAQIGVLRALEKEHVPIKAIVGTSIGALVGGLYASGYSPDELDSLMRTTRWEDLLVFGDEISRRDITYDQQLEHDHSLLTLRINDFSPVLPGALSRGARFSAFVNRLVWNAPYHAALFDNLPIPFRAVATDIVVGDRVVFDRGNLSDILRASATSPLRFDPVRMDSMLLVDGGLLGNIPTDVALQFGVAPIVVVNTTSPLHPENDLESPWNVADQVVSLMMRRQYSDALRRASVVITPPIGDHASSDFAHLDSLALIGEASALRSLPAIRAALLESAARSRGGYGSPPSAAPEPPGVPEVRQQVTTQISDCLFEGAEELVDARMTGTWLQGRMWSAELAGLICDRVNRQLRNSDYPYAAVREMRFDQPSHTLHVTVNPGIIRSVSVSGLVHSAQSVVDREIPFHVGSPFRASEAADGIASLRGTQFFRYAAMETEPLYDGVDVRVLVEEERSQVLRVYARADNERNTQLGVELAEDNLFGAGLHVGGKVYGGPRNSLLQLSFSSNRILTTHFTYNISAYAASRDIYTWADSQETARRVAMLATGEYTQQRKGARASVGRNVPHLGLVSLFARYEQYAQTRVRGDGLSGTTRVLALGADLVVDTQNDYPFATSGTVVHATYQTAPHIPEGTAAFSKLALSYESYFTFSSRHTIHPRIMWGYEDETTPVGEQFRLGGQESFMGLREDRYVGNQVLAAGVEYRILLPVRIFFDTYASARYDVGAMWPRVSEIHFGDLRHGAGVTLGFDTPIGSADFSVGQSFTIANPIADKSLAVFGPLYFYFTIGSGL
jgi:NTE family protein